MTVRAALRFILIFFFSPVGAQCADVVIYTENYPPYNYPDANGAVTGEATQLVHNVMRASGLSYEIRLLPWTRAMRNTMSDNNALIFSIVRSPEREEEFKWLVPIARDHYYLFGRANDNRPITAEHIRSGRHQVVCVFEDISCQLLRDFGLPDEAILEGIDITRADAMKLVQTGRVDFYVAGRIEFQANALNLGFDADTFGPRLYLDASMTLYLAAGKKIKPELEAAIVMGYERLLDQGKFEMLFQSGNPVNERLLNRN